MMTKIKCNENKLSVCLSVCKYYSR